MLSKDTFLGASQSMTAMLRPVATLPFATCGRSDQKPFRRYHKIGYDTMACRALHTTLFPATMDSWTTAI